MVGNIFILTFSPFILHQTEEIREVDGGGKGDKWFIFSPVITCLSSIRISGNSRNNSKVISSRLWRKIKESDRLQLQAAVQAGFLVGVSGRRRRAETEADQPAVSSAEVWPPGLPRPPEVSHLGRPAEADQELEGLQTHCMAPTPRMSSVT